MTRNWLPAIVVFVITPSIAWAGMPRVTLTEIGEMRLQTLSFFGFLFFACSWVVQRVWNGLGRDFSRLPRLGYWRATGLVAIWGLLFLLVLTMISGLRELMTPGAWEKNGLTYKLTDPQIAEPEETPSPPPAYRREKLERLKLALLAYSWNHKGELPPNTDDKAIADELWRVPDSDGAKYEYISGRKMEVGNEPLAFEPPIFGGDPWVLFTSGEIKTVPVTALSQLLATMGAKK